MTCEYSMKIYPEKQTKITNKPIFLVLAVNDVYQGWAPFSFTAPKLGKLLISSHTPFAFKERGCHNTWPNYRK